jgi:hypothetical protein
MTPLSTDWHIEVPYLHKIIIYTCVDVCLKHRGNFLNGSALAKGGLPVLSSLSLSLLQVGSLLGSDSSEGGHAQ